MSPGRPPGAESSGLSTELSRGLLADAVPPGLLPEALASAVGAHRRLLDSEHGSLVGVLRVPDDRLAAVGRAATGRPRTDPGADPSDGLRVSAVSSTGAGGVAASARRPVEGVRLVSVESTLRDLDDLSGNVDRVATAARGLDESVTVFVGLPATGRGATPGWIRAAEAIEAAGLQARLTADSQDAAALAEQLGVLIELDLPFAVDVADRVRPVALLAAVTRLIDDCTRDEAATLLSDGEPDLAAEIVGGLDDNGSARTRRRLRRIDGLRLDLARLAQLDGAAIAGP